MHRSHLTTRPLLAPAALALLGACASSTHKMEIRVSPPEASLYINGDRVGQGSRRVYDLDFGEHPRVYLQATAPGYQPSFEWKTEQEIVDLTDRNRELTITLRPH